MKAGLKGGVKMECDKVISLYRTYVIARPSEASAEAFPS